VLSANLQLIMNFSLEIIIICYYSYYYYYYYYYCILLECLEDPIIARSYVHSNSKCSHAVVVVVVLVVVVVN